MNSSRRARENWPEEAPYPLRQRFLRRVLPIVVVFLALLLISIGFTAKQVVSGAYLDWAGQRAQALARAAEHAAPGAWNALLTAAQQASLPSKENTAQLQIALRNELQELRLAKLKIYDQRRRTLFSTLPEEIGRVENGATLRKVQKHGIAGLDVKDRTDGPLYELYVPLDMGGQALVFELYEPIQRLDRQLWQYGGLLVAIALLGLSLMLLFASRVIGGAQKELDRRADDLQQIRGRMETLLSRHAVHAAKDMDQGLSSRRIDATILYSDVRGFTPFAEQQAPETVVSVLDRIISLHVHAIESEGGDVDKVIGDAVLAWFPGADGPEKAARAAALIQNEFNADAQIPLACGIGLSRGTVLLGVIGRESDGQAKRLDFSLIGDTVNVAARLCSAASGGEIITGPNIPSPPGFVLECTQSLQLKGREKAVNLQRWKLGPRGETTCASY